jgi:putative FmdB family regulatory protein
VPLYAYRCTRCDHSFEKIQSFSSEPELVCPKCGGELERPLTAPAFNFKGGGW